MGTSFTPLSGFLGGTLIGLAATLLLIANGRIAGVSGIIGGLVSPRRSDIAWRVAFVAGLWLAGLLYWAVRGELFPVDLRASWPVMVMAGALVGYGTRMGAGCTSGHGVCGIARFSQRSIVATLVFMGSAALTVFLTRHVFS